jgi:hypothetical protein
MTVRFTRRKGRKEERKKGRKEERKKGRSIEWVARE